MELTTYALTSKENVLKLLLYFIIIMTITTIINIIINYAFTMYQTG